MAPRCNTAPTTSTTPSPANPAPAWATEHQKAVLTFESARAHADNHHQRAVKLNGPAQQARAALDQDDALRETKASLLEESDKAEKELTALLRGCLADAIRDRSLMPMWFVTVLGAVPPTEKTQEWMDLATEVLAYRATYQVTDTVVALGPETDDIPSAGNGTTTWQRDSSAGSRAIRH